MTTELDLDRILVDGARLKAAREARGSSVAEMAAAVTLSREQIQAIEDGGDRPFYTPAHKLLAVRKYTTALDIPYDEIVTGPGADQTIPVPEDAPPSMMSPAQMPEPTDLRLAAVERNAELRRLMTMGVIALCIVLAIYAKLRGTPDDAPQFDSVSDLRQEEEKSPARQPARADTTPKTESPLAKNEAPTRTEAPAKVAEAKPEPAAAPKTETPAPRPDAAPKTDATAKVTLESADECPARVSTDVKSWSPAYQRKSDSRLFVVSPKGGTLCVIDASGKSTLLSLKPMVGQAVSGRPPYTVRSAELPKMDLFMQGLKVKVPSDTDTLKLIPSTQPAPPEAADTSGA
jgi:cytoskeletal protein RodZ